MRCWRRAQRLLANLRPPMDRTVLDAYLDPQPAQECRPRKRAPQPTDQLPASRTYDRNADPPHPKDQPNQRSAPAPTHSDASPAEPSSARPAVHPTGRPCRRFSGWSPCADETRPTPTRPHPRTRPHRPTARPAARPTYDAHAPSPRQSHQPHRDRDLRHRDRAQHQQHPRYRGPHPHPHPGPYSSWPVRSRHLCLRPGVCEPAPDVRRGVETAPRGQRRRQRWAAGGRCHPRWVVGQKSTSTSAAAASPAGWSRVGPMPIFSLIFFSSSLARSGLSRRKFRAFSRPWPSWSLS